MSKPIPDEEYRTYYPYNYTPQKHTSQYKFIFEDKNIFVVPTKTVPQGITAVINYMADLSAEDNVASMNEEIGNVKTGQVTYAVRDTSIDDKEIKQGD